LFCDGNGVSRSRGSKRYEEKGIGAGDERLRGLEERYEGYAVYDRAGDEIGKVDDILVDDNGHEEYIGAKLGSFGPRSTLTPVEAAARRRAGTHRRGRANQRAPQRGPTLDDDNITPELEERMRRRFGLERPKPIAEHGSRGRSTGVDAVAPVARRAKRPTGRIRIP
jgi:hypothetical protein